jgi:hypothetical protein
MLRQSRGSSWLWRRMCGVRCAFVHQMLQAWGRVLLPLLVCCALNVGLGWMPMPTDSEVLVAASHGDRGGAGGGTNTWPWTWKCRHHGKSMMLSPVLGSCDHLASAVRARQPWRRGPGQPHWASHPRPRRCRHLPRRTPLHPLDQHDGWRTWTVNAGSSAKDAGTMAHGAASQQRTPAFGMMPCRSRLFYSCHTLTSVPLLTTFPCSRSSIRLGRGRCPRTSSRYCSLDTVPPRKRLLSSTLSGCPPPAAAWHKASYHSVLQPILRTGTDAKHLCPG